MIKIRWLIFGPPCSLYIIVAAAAVSSPRGTPRNFGGIELGSLSHSAENLRGKIGPLQGYY